MPAPVFSDATTTNIGGNNPNFSFTNNAAGANSIVMLLGFWHTNGTGTGWFATPTYGGNALTQGPSFDGNFVGGNWGPGYFQISIMYMFNPPTGANTMAGTLSATSGLSAQWAAISYTGVDPSSPFGALSTQRVDAGNAFALTPASNATGLIIDFLGLLEDAAGTTVTPGAGQTQRATSSSVAGTDQLVRTWEKASAAGTTSVSLGLSTSEAGAYMAFQLNEPPAAVNNRLPLMGVG